MFQKFVAATALLVAAMTVVAVPAYADGPKNDIPKNDIPKYESPKNEGPKNEHEAAVCRSIVHSLLPGLGDGVCAVQHGG